MTARGTRYEQITLNLFRIVVGFLFWQHGAQKLFGWLGGFREPGQRPSSYPGWGWLGSSSFLAAS